MSEVGKRDYKNGKIYVIRNLIDNEIYIGSTCQQLCKRFQKHKDDSKGYKKDRKLYSKMNEIGKDQFYIELYEEYPCNNVEQLRKREGEVIRNTKAILNSKIEGRTQKEWREDNMEYKKELDKKHYENNKDKYRQQGKEYREEHKEYIKEWKKNHYEANKEQILKKQREYHNINKEARNAKSREYGKNHKEEIKAMKNKKCQCECGITFSHANKARHLKSKYHQDFLNNNISNVSQPEEEPKTETPTPTHIT